MHGLGMSRLCTQCGLLREAKVIEANEERREGPRRVWDTLAAMGFYVAPGGHARVKRVISPSLDAIVNATVSPDPPTRPPRGTVRVVLEGRDGTWGWTVRAWGWCSMDHKWRAGRRGQCHWPSLCPAVAMACEIDQRMLVLERERAVEPLVDEPVDERRYIERKGSNGRWRWQLRLSHELEQP